MLIVQKYGGSSLADDNCLRRAASRITQLVSRGHKLVVVVSAQGKTTDSLLQKLPPSIPPREKDAYLSTGEQLSAPLLATMLWNEGIPAISLTGWQAGILTDSCHTDARVLELSNQRITRELDKGNTVIVTGFQGVTQDGDITTLGRGGSDTTAVALAAFLHADKCMIYTDVDGVYDKDPRKYPNATKIPQIGYDRMLEMARNGAQVLHDRCVELAKQYHVPIQVLSSFRPGDGTMVFDP